MFILSLLFKINFVAYAFYIIGIALIFILIRDFLSDLALNLVSLRRFLPTSILTSIFCGAFLAVVFFKDSIQLIAFSAIGALVWIFISLLANTKISTLANAIVAGFIGILTIILNLCISVLPLDNIFNIPISQVEIVESLGYSIKEIFEIGVNIILMPIFITNAIAVMMCQIKSYWLEKYYKDTEISWGTLKQ